jgi:hypothetical protein
MAARPYRFLQTSINSSKPIAVTDLTNFFFGAAGDAAQPLTVYRKCG